MSQTAAFLNVFKLPDLRKKIYVTIGLLFIYRIGFHIPLPGVDVRVLQGFTSDLSGNNILGLMNVISGGRFQFPVLCSLGILPYITSSIIFSLLVKVIPSLEALSKEGPAGQRKINQLTRLMTVPLCIIQALILCFTQFKDMAGEVAGQEGVRAFLVPGLHGDFGDMVGVTFLIVAGLTAGTLFVMWLGEQITEFGVGNGASLIIMAGIIAQLPFSVSTVIAQATEDRAFILTIAILILCYIGVVLGVVMITKGQRRIPIQQQKLVRGGRVVGGARHYLPLKVNMANVMPVIFASSLIMFPNLIYSAATGGSMLLAYGGFWYTIAFIALIFFFAFFWTSMMFQPAEMANNLKEYGSFVPGIRPGRKTAEFLERIMVRITLAGATFLAVIAIIPTIVASTMNVDEITASFLGGTGVLIVVGVALDLVDKLNAQLVARNYEGFMGGSANRANR